MRRPPFVCFLLLLALLCCHQSEPELYTIGILQMNDAPTLTETRVGFIRSLADQGLVDGKQIRIVVKNGEGRIPQVQSLAEEFVIQDVDMLVTLSTPSLQAALHATRDIPIIFASVANPYLAGAGASPQEHLQNVAGVSSEGPIRQSLAFIKSLLPETQRIGTLWTPSELNSIFYLDKAREGAAELGLEIVAVPIANPSEILLSAQLLINHKIDVIYQISDNTINQAFESVAKVAVDNGVPLFGGFLSSTEMGACAALGWDFQDMGYQAGALAVRVKNGESPGGIPFQYMDKVLLHLNPKMAELQGIEFPEKLVATADKVLHDSI